MEAVAIGSKCSNTCSSSTELRLGLFACFLFFIKLCCRLQILNCRKYLFTAVDHLLFFQLCSEHNARLETFRRNRTFDRPCRMAGTKSPDETRRRYTTVENLFSERGASPRVARHPTEDGNEDADSCDLGFNPLPPVLIPFSVSVVHRQTTSRNLLKQTFPEIHIRRWSSSSRHPWTSAAPPSVILEPNIRVSHPPTGQKSRHPRYLSSLYNPGPITFGFSKLRPLFNLSFGFPFSIARLLMKLSKVARLLRLLGRLWSTSALSRIFSQLPGFFDLGWLWISFRVTLVSGNWAVVGLPWQLTTSIEFFDFGWLRVLPKLDRVKF